jgi:hypothetical protein
MVPSEEVVNRILHPFHDLLFDIVSGAWEDWLNSSEFAFIESPSTRASIVWSRTIGRAKAAFVEIPNITIRGRYNTYSFVVDDTILFRFKKGNQDGFTANYPTQTALAFHDHSDNDPECLQASLFPMEDYLRVEVVYTLNNLQTELDRIRVVARNKSKIAWDYDIRPIIPAITEIPVLPDAGTKKARPLVQPKITRKAKKSTK